MSAQEFQAIVLAAGRGSRMTELTVGRPKCLMPVGQYPILYHSLRLLEKAGFKEAIVVVLNSALNQIQSGLSRCDLTINPEYVAISSDEDWGTADSLRYLLNQELIKSDVVLVSCDTFTNVSLTNLLLRFRQHDASLAALFFPPLDHSVLLETPPGIKSKLKPEKDIVGVDLEGSRLAFLASASDFEETVPLKRSILRRHPRLSIRTDLVDGHIYVLSLKLAKFLSLSGSFSTLKGEFLPYVVSKQHSRIPAPESNAQVDEKFQLLNGIMKGSRSDDLIRDASTYIDHRGDLKGLYHGDTVRCYAVIADSDQFGIRLNSISSLWQANRMVSSSNEENLVHGVRVDPTAEVLTNQTEESFISANCCVKEKTSVRGAVVGEGCVILPRTRITRSTILKKTEIKEGCIIENCIIGNDVKIGETCELKNCIVGSNHHVLPGTKSAFQVLTQSDRLMEI